jgi:hypothetical protein
MWSYKVCPALNDHIKLFKPIIKCFTCWPPKSTKSKARLLRCHLVGTTFLSGSTISRPPSCLTSQPALGPLWLWSLLDSYSSSSTPLKPKNTTNILTISLSTFIDSLGPPLLDCSSCHFTTTVIMVFEWLCGMSVNVVWLVTKKNIDLHWTPPLLVLQKPSVHCWIITAPVQLYWNLRNNEYNNIIIIIIIIINHLFFPLILYIAFNS